MIPAVQSAEVLITILSFVDIGGEEYQQSLSQSAARVEILSEVLRNLDKEHVITQKYINY